jgi:sterol desaturase/sphingolipid hydroxylase (fatty acid hydroxylase superfamily)
LAGFPGALGLTFWGFFALMGAGWDPVQATGPPIAAHYTFLALAERWLPWHRSWLHSRGDLRTDVGLFALNGAMGGVVGPALLVGATALGAAISARWGGSLWPGDWPLLLQLPLALVVAELVEYSFHRAMHEVPWLWRFHATHHSAPRLYWLNAVRFHPVDLFLVGVVKMVPLALLGAAAPVLALVNLVSAVHGAYQHANVPVRLGPLNWIFSMTELHRWHHSPIPAESNHNYGGNLIVWDVIFGTRWLPADREPPEAIGIESLPAFPMGFWANLAAPFRWRRLVQGSAPAAARAVAVPGSS